MLKIANQLDEINRRALNDGGRRLADLFASFRNRISLLLGGTLGVGIILAGISTANILRLERVSERHYQETLQIQAELKKLSARLVEVQEQERRSLSRELHDEIGQSLSAILVDLGNLSSFLPSEQKEARQISSAIKVLAENTLGTIRNMALLLRPSMLDDFGLIPALDWLARELSRRTGLPVKVIAEELPDILTEEQKTCIFRVTQEALNNIARHAEAASALVRVEQTPDCLKLTIQDDGVGFNPIRTRGMGLVGMEERVRNLHGTMQMESKIGNGTIIKIELPLNLPEEKVTHE
jgi:signal transduction histidine kinase